MGIQRSTAEASSGAPLSVRRKLPSLRVQFASNEDKEEERVQFTKEDEVFFEKYQFVASSPRSGDKILGQGTSCVVRKGERRRDQLPVAVKVTRSIDEES